MYNLLYPYPWKGMVSPGDLQVMNGRDLPLAVSASSEGGAQTAAYKTAGVDIDIHILCMLYINPWRWAWSIISYI